MSNTLQNKLFNAEVTPPATAWDHIAKELDENYIGNHFPSVLANAELLPPSMIWSAVESELNNSEQKFSSKLYDMQALPPAAIWSNIATELDKSEEKVIPQRRRIPAFVKYAAAAMFIGIVVMAGYKLLEKTSGTNIDNPVASQGGSLNDPKQSTNIFSNEESANPSSPEEIVSAQELRDEAALEESKRTYASIDVTEKTKMISRINQELIGQPASPINASDNISPQNTYKDVECSDVHSPSFAGINPAFESASRYTLLLSPDGHMIRVSKKLGDMVCCVSGEEQDEDCKDQLDKWRKKIANSPVAPSPENFMDILDLLHALKDKSL